MKNTFIYGALTNMTSAENKIAKYISENIDNIADLTSTKLADEVGVSQSTVIKFSQKLGYPTYKRMILDITSDQPDDDLNDELDYTG